MLRKLTRTVASFGQLVHKSVQRYQSHASAADDSLRFDVLVVGAGPAGLAAAIRLKQLQPERSVCVLEKGSEVGAHILSGNCLDTRALDELLPEWRQDASCPVRQPVTSDHFQVLLNARHALPLPVPPQMRNHGNYVVSLSQVTRWLGARAESLGVEVYPGFAGKRLLFSADGERVVGVETNEFGVGEDGRHKENYVPGVALYGQYTLLAEGCRGSLTQQAARRYQLHDQCQPQTYALGVKEVWRVRPERHQPGRVRHTVGWPLDWRTYGGSFEYHMGDEPGGAGQHLVALGFVAALDYHNPYLSPFDELQRWKTHASNRRLLEGGEPVQYGARCINEGGLQSVPRLVFPGGALIGCAAGFLNVPKIKGTHTAMKSGLLAAEACARALNHPAADSASSPPLLPHYEQAVRESWIWEELYRVRNIRPGFRLGLWGGLAQAAWDTYIMRGRAPYTLRHGAPDHQATQPAAAHRRIAYPRPDGRITRDILTSLALSGTNHDHDQPCHLRLRDPTVPQRVNLPQYDGLEQRYCPAKVYEYVERGASKQLQIHAQNCLHCKACDIKDPQQNIEWTVPQGGEGPKYTLM
ncbi:hypothetical protein CDCA_CDCA12G3470 [Cyanidium caldarium]|uniref:Electron transfer flavoprotein-ubiquinone oxidoreductase n=1 Tax=Cyanidium caldarium TaxID=2771 RepID=A0AAV9IZC0_CYACA|nr:hypothetical protein CDCA_CDCA12G3470 [Cyanidium caldarium]